MDNDNSIKKAIQTRYSCRSFLKEPINKNLLNQLEESFKSAAIPFQSKIRLSIIAAKENDSADLKGLGTYGFIKNPMGFIVGTMKESEKCLEDFGYYIEQIVLKATQLGIGTCWLGGTFNQSTFAKRVSCADDETIPAVIAIGMPAKNKRIFELIARKSVNADKRKPWKEIFFNHSFNTPLKEDDGLIYKEPLSLLRLSPSSNNFQPWRIVKVQDKNNFHFFLQRRKEYREPGFWLKADLARVDLGIAMCHFELSTKEQNLKGEWIINQPDIQNIPAKCEYVATWKEK